MSEKGFIGRRIDQMRETRADKTRVHDIELAVDMARAELPYRDAAAVQKKVGKALVSAMWNNYPDFKSDAVVTTEELSRRTDGAISDDQITRSVSEAIRRLANDHRKKEPFPMTDRGISRHIRREAYIRGTDPTEVPNALAQKLGYKLEHISEELVQVGINNAEKIQAQHQEVVPSTILETK